MTTLTPSAIARRIEQAQEALVAQHSRTRSAASFAQYEPVPGDLQRSVERGVAFSEVELGFKLYPKQIDVVAAFLSGKRTVVRGCHGAGKDAVLAVLALFAAYVRGMLVLCLSATEKQLHNQLWREVSNRFTARLPGELYTSDLRIDGQKRIIAMTAGAGSVSHLTGWHDPRGVCVLVSESQAESVGDDAFDAAESNTIDDLSKIVVVGNPVKTGSRFHRIHAKPSWQSVQISAFDHPNLLERRVVIPGGPAPSWPDEMRGEYGAASAFYVARVLAEFPSESVEGLVRSDWIRNAFAKHASGELEAEACTHPPLFALDVARYGPDRTVLAIVRGPVVKVFHTWRGASITQTVDRVIAHASVPGAFVTQPVVHVDEPGLGGGAIDVFRERKWPVYAFNGSRPSTDPTRFLNLRAESHWHFRNLLESGRIALPPDDGLAEEALAIEWTLGPKGQIQILAKETLRATLGRSPDKLDAVVICLSRSVPNPSRRVGSFRPIY
jgi:hypothetical protein